MIWARGAWSVIFRPALVCRRFLLVQSGEYIKEELEQFDVAVAPRQVIPELVILNRTRVGLGVTDLLGPVLMLGDAQGQAP